LTGEPAVDEIARVALLALPAQVADKVCALFERHGPGGYVSSRARDLADVAMIATQKHFDGAQLTNHLRREERRRLEAQTLVEPLPVALRLADEQIADWEPRWHKATRGAPIDFDEAQAVAARFMDPVLQDSVEDKRWSAAKQQWS
jgi:nucleotidyltransferase AbiEii toxin of type IV toxin-antitoxin system